MLHLLLGRAGTGKTGELHKDIHRRVEAGEGKNYLIVPEQYSHEAERELCRVCGDRVSLYAEVLSFSRLARNVALERGGSARVYVDKGGRLLQLTLALEQIDGALTVFSGAARQPERMLGLLSALEELRHAGSTPEDMRALASEATPALGDKLRDLALVQEGLAAMEAQSGADPALRLDVLAEQVSDCTLLRDAHIYIDGFTDFTAQEKRVIRELWLVADVTVCLGCDSMTGDSEVFDLSRRTARQLRDLACADGVEVTERTVDPPPAHTPLHHLEENLFAWTDETFDSQGAIRLASAHSVEAECELAAAECLRLAREQGARWRDMAIAVRGFGDYESALRRVFSRYGVPLYSSVRTDIFTHALPGMVSAAFDLVGDGWSYESVFSYLKTGLAGIDREDIDLLENYVLLWNIRGTQWTKNDPWRQHPEGYNRDVTPESRTLLEKLDTTRRQVAVPLKIFQEQGKAAHTAREQCRVLAQLWDNIALPEHLEERAGALEAQGELQAAAEYRQLWEIMVSALEQCAAVLGDLPMEQEAFGRLFRRMLSRYNVGTIPVALDRVTAGDFDRMRRRGFRHLLVLGASDDRLPRTGENGGIFTESERTELRRYHWEIPDADDVLDREISLIYNVFSLPSETLYVSRSQFTADGTPTRPSFVMDRIRKLFDLREERENLSLARSSALHPALELAAAGDSAARRYFSQDPSHSRRLETVLENAKYARGRLNRESVRALYGSELYLTASRIDTFASCRFQYFLRYGLNAKPRQTAGFEAPDLGTFLHHVLEMTARDAGAMGGFPALTEEQINALTDKHVEQYIHEKLDDFKEKTPRFKYLFTRLTKQVRRIVLDTARELQRSDFQPLDFELNFSRDRDMPPIAIGEGEESLVLTGVVDRVDGMKKDGKLYLRVVDYKSGRKKFSLTDVWYGMGLQMLLYLFTLEREGERKYGCPIVPTGVLYVPAREVLLSGKTRMTDEEILAEKAKALKRSGLLLSDEDVLHAMEHGEKPVYLPVKLNRDGKYAGDSLATAVQLSKLSEKVDSLLKGMASELHGGSIAADPWYGGENESTCAMCDYFNACHFDEKTDGWRYRTHLKAPEFWAKLDETEKGDTPCL